MLRAKLAGLVLVFFVVTWGSAYADVPVTTAKTSATQSHSVLAESGPLAATLNGQAIDYRMTVNATHVSERAAVIPDHKIVSYAYKAETGQADRPIIFAYNGGPGSPSYWLHMSAWGPKRLMTPGSPESTEQIPFGVEDNPAFLIDAADIVFVDPVGTGLSVVTDEARPSFEPFQDVRRDSRAVCLFVKAWLEAEGRTDADVYLAGASYAGLRVTGAVAHPVCRSIQPNIKGVILISPLLDLRARRDKNHGFELSVPAEFPTLAAIAWHHDKVDKSKWSGDVESFLEDAETFALRDLAYAIRLGDDIPADLFDTAKTDVERFLGLGGDWVVTPSHLTRLSKLARADNDRKRLGRAARYDGRYLVEQRRRSDILPGVAFEVLKNEFVQQLDMHLKSNADFDIGESYVDFLSFEDRVNWTYDYRKSSDWGQGTNMAAILRPKMSRNGDRTDFRIFSTSGLHDQVTPYFAVEQAFRGARYPKDSYEIHLYPGGHMMYFDKDVSIDLANKVRAFVTNDETVTP